MSKKTNNIVLVTGSSGAGKSIALKALEDLGYDAVDNIPLSILPNLIDAHPKDSHLAVGLDARNQNFTAEKFLAATKGLKYTLLFLDADTDVLHRRFSETRRRHPLAKDRPIADGIKHEKHLIKPLKKDADYVIDTSNFSQVDLRNWIRGHFATDENTLQTTITSFSYKGGLPREADLVFDARFLRNPHYVPDLEPLDGRNSKVAEYVEADDNYKLFMKSLTNLIIPLLPAYKAEGKSYLTIAIGCTGGKHRSVAIVEALAKILEKNGFKPDVRHRDV